MTEKRLIEIETKLAYQEDLIEDLNQAIVSMQKQIDDLELQNNRLNESLRQIEQTLPNDQEHNETPPHY